MTTTHVIEIPNSVTEQEKNSGPTVLSKNINPSLGTVLTLSGSLPENSCIIKVYNPDTEKSADIEISSDLGPVPSNNKDSSKTQALYKIEKITVPQNTYVSENEKKINIDQVYKTIAKPVDPGDMDKSKEHRMYAEQPFKVSKNRQLDKQSDDKISEENTEKTPSVIMFKWGSVNKPFRCQICDMAFTDGNLLRTHLEKHNSSRKEPLKPFPCKLCTKSFQSNRSLERHQNVHSGQSQKRCKYCYKIFANKENLEKHVQMHSGNKAHTCVFCNEQFSSRHCLQKHVARHALEKHFQCHICEKQFNRKDTLDRHMLTHCDGKRNKHECVECKKSFSYLFALKRHVRSVHAGEPDGKACEICGKFIKNRENINRHMQLHEGLRPHECPECKRKFTQKQHLVDHMVTHSNALPFACKICCLSFRYRRSLSRHLKKHYIAHAKTQEMECTVCNSMFSSEKEIIQHVESAHINFYVCFMCKQSFSDEKSCMKHMLQAHDLPIEFINKTLRMNVVNKSTETDPTELESNISPTGSVCKTDPTSSVCNADSTGSECNANPTGSVCNADPSGTVCNNNPTRVGNPLNQECNAITGTRSIDQDMDINCAEDTITDENIDSSIEKFQGEEYTAERTEVFGNVESGKTEETNADSDGSQVIYILYDQGQEVCQLQKFAVDKVITQTGLQVSDFAPNQAPQFTTLDGDQIIQIAEFETQSNSDEIEADNNSEILQITDETTENVGQEVSNIEIAQSYPNVYQNIIDGTSGKEFSYTYNVVVPEGEKEDGIIDSEKFVAERSKLLQSLIDYAEKIQVEEQSNIPSSEVACASETKI